MIVIVNAESKEVQIVDHGPDDFRDFYGEDWSFVRELEADEDPSWMVWDASAEQLVAGLAALEKLLHERIDAQAGAVRLRFISDSPGQALTYQRKEAEARAWVADPETPMASLPFLAAEVAATEADAAACAATIIAAADAWAQVGSTIEGCRIAAKRAVSAATNASDMAAAAIVDWAAVAAVQDN